MNLFRHVTRQMESSSHIFLTKPCIAHQSTFDMEFYKVWHNDTDRMNIAFDLPCNGALRTYWKDGRNKNRELTSGSLSQSALPFQWRISRKLWFIVSVSKRKRDPPHRRFEFRTIHFTYSHCAVLLVGITHLSITIHSSREISEITI